MLTDLFTVCKQKQEQAHFFAGKLCDLDDAQESLPNVLF